MSGVAPFEAAVTVHAYEIDAGGTRRLPALAGDPADGRELARVRSGWVARDAAPRPTFW